MTESGDWDGRAHGHPVIAMLAGGAVLVVAAVLAPRLLPQQPLPTLLILGGGLGAALWLVGLAITIRRSSAVWMLGSLAVLAGAGVGAGLTAHGQYQSRARVDASSFAEIEFAPDGAPRLPSGIAARGPISRLYADAVQADAAEERAFADALGRFGLATLNSPYLLEQDPRAIGDCAALKQVAALARDQDRHRATRKAALARAIATASLPGEAKRGIAMMAGSDDQAARLANRLAMLDASGELCALLARRGWYNQGGYFGFRGGADKAAFDALRQRQRGIAGDAAQIERAARERMTQGRELVRDALGRSIYAAE